MRKFILFLCITLLLGTGCSSKNVKIVEDENKITIPTINIEAPKGIVIEVISADPTYLEPRNGEKETLLTVRYIVRNNTDTVLHGADYEVLCIGYSSVGKALFEKRSSSLFYKVSELAPRTYTEGSFHTGFINGIEKIDRLDISLR